MEPYFKLPLLGSGLPRLFPLFHWRRVEVNGVREVPRDDLEQSAVGEGGALPLGQSGPRRGGRVGSQLQNGIEIN